jgi:hypothetical protein
MCSLSFCFFFFSLFLFVWNQHPLSFSVGQTKQRVENNTQGVGGIDYFVVSIN